MKRVAKVSGFVDHIALIGNFLPRKCGQLRPDVMIEQYGWARRQQRLALSRPARQAVTAARSALAALRRLSQAAGGSPTTR